MTYLATIDTRIDLDSRSSVWSIVFLAVLGAAMFLLQPGYIQGLVQYAEFSEEQAGLVAAFEMFGIAATAILINFRLLSIRKNTMRSFAKNWKK